LRRGLLLLIVIIMLFIGIALSIRVLGVEAEELPIVGRFFKKEEPVLVYSLGEVVTDLADEDGRKFIQVEVEVTVKGQGVLEELELKRSKILSRLLAVLRSKTYADVNGSEGMRLVGEEIRQEINSLLERGQVLEVLFLEFIVQ